jgi:hypothetical protein
MLAEEVVDLFQQLENLTTLVKWLYVLVGVIGIVLAWRQRRIARNQVELAELLRGECCQRGSD